MSVTKKMINGKEYFEVYAWADSKKIPGLRLQKRRRINSSKSEALRLEKTLTQELAIKIEKEETRGECWFEICKMWKNEFLNKQTDRYAAETVIDNFSALSTWGANFWKKPATEIKSGDIREMLRVMSEAKKSKGFMSRVKYAFNTVYSWGIEMNYIKGVDRSPAHGITVSRKEAKNRTDVLNKNEAMKLLKSALTLEHLWYPIWFLALSTGMRNGELHALRFIDLDFSANDGQGNIVVKRSYNTRRKEDKTTKSGDWRNVPMNSAIKEFLLSLKNSANGCEHVLPRFKDWDRGDQSKILRNFCSSIGITSIHFHALRATFATQMLQSNIAPATVMKIGGWKDLETMAIYLRLSGVEEKGATECLSVLMPTVAMNNLLPMIDLKKQ